MNWLLTNKWTGSAIGVGMLAAAIVVEIMESRQRRNGRP